jgi:hypothetical protein
MSTRHECHHQHVESIDRLSALPDQFITAIAEEPQDRGLGFEHRRLQTDRVDGCGGNSPGVGRIGLPRVAAGE